MSSSQHIKVFVRCRPQSGQENCGAIKVDSNKNEITVADKSFHFDGVFGPQSSQWHIYKLVVEPLIEQVLIGFNCTVLAYGQTGTGKTYTMEGLKSDKHQMGIIPRAITQLFDTLKEHEEDFNLRVSFLELYNEDAYDLLDPIDDAIKLRIFEDTTKKGSIIVEGLKEVEVSSKEAILDILEQGSAKRKIASTTLNASSSRSHTIFTVYVDIRDESTVRTGKINLVDLAGSENIGRSGAQDKRAREAGNINQALLTLGRVITALVERRPHIPYRESKLTRLLQDSLGGKTRTSLIATISPSPSDYEDTLTTLDYASRAKVITNRPEVNQRSTSSDLESEKEIERLKKILEDTERRHKNEIGEIEYKVRNEVAVEFRREAEKMKQSYKKNLSDLMEDRDNQIEELEAKLKDMDDKFEVVNQLANDRLNQVGELEIKLKEMDNKFKVVNQLAIYRLKLVEELEVKLKDSSLENRDQRDEIRQLKDKLEQVELKKVNKVKAKVPMEEATEYANMTFETNDEILGSTRKKVLKARKRVLNESITLSGKKKKIKDADAEPELSPIVTRVTRSRVTRRKLNF